MANGPHRILGPIFGFDPDEYERERELDERLANASGAYEILGAIFGFDPKEAMRETLEAALVDDDDPIGLGLPPMSLARNDDDPLGIFGECGEPDDSVSG